MSLTCKIIENGPRWCSYTVSWFSWKMLKLLASLYWFSGKTEGKGARIPEKKGKRRTGDGEGASESSQEGGSFIFPGFTCGNN